MVHRFKTVYFIFNILSVSLFGAVSDSSAVILNFAGDVTFANHFEYYVGERWNYPFDKFPEFSMADLSIVNLENPLTRGGIPSEKQFNFRARPEYTRVLKAGGIDIVNLANNHIYDYSEQGLFDTIDFLDQAGIRHIGAGKNMAFARKPVLLKIKGVRIAFLGYYGLRKHSGSHPATADSAGTALRNLSYIKQDIKAVRDSTDVVIVTFHWGIEKEHVPEVDQIYFAHKTIQYGADLIVGHHPHVLQGIEKYRNGLIVYSLGNFIFGGNSRIHENTAVLQIKIDSISKKITSYKMLPVQVDYWQPRLLRGFQKQALLDSLTKYSSLLEQKQEYSK